MAKIRMKMNEFRVTSGVKPLAYDVRTPIELNTHDKFYFSYRENIVCSCRIESTFVDDEGRLMACVVLLDSVEGSRHYLYADEIGRTPEEAIMHQWKFI